MPIKLKVLYKEKIFQLSIHYLFFSYKIFPIKTQQNQGKKLLRTKKLFPFPIKRFSNNRLEETLKITRLLIDLLPRLGQAIGYILQKVKVVRCRVVLRAEGYDIVQAALRYGKIHGILYSLYSLMVNLIQVKEFKVSVIPNFLGEESADVDILLKLRLSSILFGGLLFLVGSLNILLNTIFSMKKEKNN